MTTETAHVLPDEVVDFLRDLHRSGRSDSANYYFKLSARCGWSLRKIGSAVGLSAEAIRNRIKDIELDTKHAVSSAPVFPTYLPATKPKAEKKPKERRYVIPAEVSKKMASLRDLAAQVSRNTPVDAPSRIASETLASLMNVEKKNGATYQEIAEATGLTSWSAVKFRLGRHGYIDLPPSMAHERIIL